MKKMLNIVVFAAVILLLTIFNSSKAFAIETTRYGGADRYATALEVSRNNWGNSDYVILASGKDYPDALCATPLAKKYNAPILLTQGDTLTADIKSEFTRLSVKNVYIIGGTGVISQNVENTIKALGIKVTRLGGIDRYKTSLLVAKELAKELGASTKVAIASGENFPDAVSVAAPAALSSMPILLSNKSTIDNEIKQFITSTSRDVVYVIGGTGAISDTVLKQFSNTKRLAGADRIQTNLAVINEFWPALDLSNVNVFVASAQVFPDGLAGSAAAALTASPVFLLDNSNLAPSISLLTPKITESASFKILGGTGAISLSIEQRLKTLKNKTVVIDAGHGGQDSGAVGPTKILEKNVNLAVALKLGALLQAQGINVVYTRVDDNIPYITETDNLKIRTDIANNANADFFISIHCNSADSSSANGSEAWYSAGKPSDSSLAKTLLDNLVAANGLYERTVQGSNLYVVKNTKMPAVLMELAFINNPTEEKLLNSPDFQAKCAAGLANGIMKVLGLS
ncbi:cell wall-binding repeat-containing protein [Candidatus Clostridium stratigraminis]|uniref:Cell wall-binding repeat-containing protein n=1 Tax=Candidatus Clostridium stratigraminis TaxID=3381661 RepID=A0ABW8SYJ7_9CLOT